MSNPEVVYLSLRDIRAKAEQVAEAICKMSLDGAINVFGIPRGGIVPAYAVSEALRTYGRISYVVDNPEDCHVIVDDIVDSGRTRDQWVGRYKRPFFALYEGDPDRWYVFPWEGVLEASVTDIGLRLAQKQGVPQNDIDAYAETVTQNLDKIHEFILGIHNADRS